MSEVQNAILEEVGESAIISVSDALEANPATPLEKAMAKIDKKKEMAAKTPAEAHFRFREQLTPNQLAELQKNAPQVAELFIKDVNQIMKFGGSTIAKLRQTSIEMLNAQKNVEIPEADKIINDLLRNMDGMASRYGNVKFEEFGKKILGLFQSAKYSVKNLSRDLKSMEEKLDLTELKLTEMDSTLEENVIRGQIIHKRTLEHMNEVVRVLADLEEIIENIRREYEEVDALLTGATASGEQFVEYKGRRVSVNELQEIQSQISLALSESEKSWHDWRQQFFIGWANAPATRNLVITTIALRRRLMVFRDMGIQSGRHAMVTWKQAVEARQGAELGNAVQDATNQMMRRAYEEVADTTDLIAKASQAPIVTEETVMSMIASVKRQAQSVVEADRAGRALRAKNVQALERGEVEILDEVLSMQAQLADNARKDKTLTAGSSTGNAAGITSGTDQLLNGITSAE